MNIKMKLNRIYPTVSPKVLCISVVLLSSCVAYAQTIVSVNFSGDGTFTLGSSDSVGAPGYEAVNWNNISGSSGGPVALLDSTGAASGITLSTYIAGNGNTANGSDGTAQEKLYSTGLVTNFGSSNFQLTGLDAFTDYDIVVYYSGGTSFAHNRHMEVTASGSSDTYYVAGMNTVFSAYTQGTNTNPASHQSSNYAIYEGLSGASQTITLGYVNNSVTLSGFQVIGTTVPEPGETAALLGAFALVGVWLIRRRLKA